MDATVTAQFLSTFGGVVVAGSCCVAHVGLELKILCLSLLSSVPSLSSKHTKLPLLVNCFQSGTNVDPIIESELEFGKKKAYMFWEQQEGKDIFEIF